MQTNLPKDVTELKEALKTNTLEASGIVKGLSEEGGTWRAKAGSWSVAECFDHLAVGNRVYLRPMEESASQARRQGRLRKGPLRAGWIGRLFLMQLEPPPKWWSKLKAPGKIQPSPSPPLAQAFADFEESQEPVIEFLEKSSDLDLSGIRFSNPFIPGLRFNVATGLYVLAVHGRRHLWQARQIRLAFERSTRSATTASS